MTIDSVKSVRVETDVLYDGLHPEKTESQERKALPERI